MLAAAKNHAFVVPICRPADYESVLAELRETGEVAGATRRQLAGRAFATTAAYDAAVAAWLSGGEAFPETVVLAFDRVAGLSYGENPHQEAAYYAERGTRTHLLARVEQLLTSRSPSTTSTTSRRAPALAGPGGSA
jgi:phosphoribosylaminoimidazolecarboxamide formyltransferase/IMP cyclohydrolase